MLRGLMTEDRTQVVLAPEEFAGSAGLQLPAAGVPAMLTSETPEEVYYWRARLAAQPEWCKQAEDTYLRIAEALRDGRRENVREVAGQTLENLREIRIGLDHLQATAKDKTGATWERINDQIASLTRDYVKMASVVYGNAFPLDGDTGQPVLPEGLDEYPFLTGFATEDGTPVYDLDTLGLGAAYVAAMERWGAGGLVPEDQARGYSPDGTIAALTIIDSLALTPVGLTAAASLVRVSSAARKIIERLAREADQGR